MKKDFLAAFEEKEAAVMQATTDHLIGFYNNYLLDSFFGEYLVQLGFIALCFIICGLLLIRAFQGSNVVLWLLRASTGLIVAVSSAYLLFIISTMLYFKSKSPVAFESLLKTQGYFSYDDAVSSAKWLLFFSLTLCSAVFYLISSRLEPYLSLSIKKRSSRADAAFSDVRELLFPPAKPFDPSSYYEKARDSDSVFWGIGEDAKPIFIPLSKYHSSNIQVMGPPGTGKGVLAQILLCQSILRGERVVVFDPKQDDWLPFAYKQACEKAGLPFTYINLRNEKAQINPILATSQDEIAELLIAALDFEEKGDNSDVYSNAAQYAIHKLSKVAIEKGLGLYELSYHLPDVLSDKELQMVFRLKTKLDVLAELGSIRTTQGLNLTTSLSRGGCLFIVGDDSSNKKDVMKLILIRIFQLIKNINPEDRAFVSIFADEVKSLISQTFIEQIGQLRSRKANIIYAHQSPADLDRETPQAQATLNDNAQLRVFYRQQDPRTAEIVAGYSGKKVTESKIQNAERNSLSKEILSGNEVKQVETQSYLFDTNIIQNLPDKTGIIVGYSLSRLTFCSPPIVKKSPLDIFEAEPKQVEAKKETRTRDLNEIL